MSFDPKLKLARLADGSPEIFHTLQGEGRNAGAPSVFVRLSLCNLHCFWCDTDYTWNWEGTPFAHEREKEPGYTKFRREDEILEMPVEEVAGSVARWPARRVILTGGEPLLQADGLRALCRRLREQDPAYVFEMETNGTREAGAELESLVGQFNVSPKLANSRNPETLRKVGEVLQRFAALPTADFKFVVAAEGDLDEISRLVEVCGMPGDRVFLMPEGRTPEDLRARARWLAGVCLERGFRFSDRQHVHWFGGGRGV